MVGSIVLVNKATLEKKIATLNELGDYPGEDWTPIGVVVIPAEHDVYGNGKAGVMSLVPMNCDTPTTGADYEQLMCWGKDSRTYKIPTFVQTPVCGTTKSSTNIVDDHRTWPFLPSDYFTHGQCMHDKNSYYRYEDTSPAAPSPYRTDGSRNPMYIQTTMPSSKKNCLSDFNGRYNSDMMLKARGERNYVQWKPRCVIADDYPAFSCCDMFHTIGTVQGEWYLPSMGEIGYLVARRKMINNALKAIDVIYRTEAITVINDWYWTSTNFSVSHARKVSLKNGDVYYGHKGSDNCVRAWLQV